MCDRGTGGFRMIPGTGLLYTPDSLKMHAQAAIHRDFQAGDMSDLTISNIKENPPSVTGKRNIDFTVSSAASGQGLSLYPL